MDLRLSDEQILLRDSARRFFAENYDYAARTGFAAEPGGFSRETWTAIAAFGWLAVPLPEAAGGFGGDGADIAVLMTEFGRVLAVDPFLSSVVMGASLLAELDPELPLIGEIAGGEKLVAVALGAEESVAARADGEGWALTGNARTVLNAETADRLLVPARIGESVALFSVDPAHAALDSFPLVDDRRASNLLLENANALRIGGDATEALAATLDRAIAAACAEMLGGLEFLVAETAAYCRTRVQFRQPLFEFQVIRHRLAEMSVALEEARAATLFAALYMRGPADMRTRAASAAKAKVGRAARFIAREAVQLHGGMGVTEELSVGAYYKRAIAFDALFGPVERHNRRAAAAVRAKLLDAGEAMICADREAA